MKSGISGPQLGLTIVAPVSMKEDTPPEKKALGKTSFQRTEEGAGEQFLPQDCRAKARVKGVFCSADTGRNGNDRVSFHCAVALLLNRKSIYLAACVGRRVFQWTPVSQNDMCICMCIYIYRERERYNTIYMYIYNYI